MHTGTIGKKGKVAALLAAVAVVLGGAFSPLTPTATADSTTANSLSELKAQINGASGARTITLGNDIAWDGNSITIPAGKNITIFGDHTIFRSKNASTLNSMFDVKGTLTLGGKVKLSGKTGSCGGPQTVTPKVSGPFGGEIPEIEDDEFWEEWPADQKFAPFRGKNQRVMIGFPDMERDSGSDDDPGVAHLSGDGGLIMAAEENVFKDVTEWLYPGREDEVVGHNPDGTPIRGYRVKRAYLQEGVDLNEYVFTIVDIMDDEWQAGYFKTSDGKYLGRPGSGNLTPVRIVEKNAAGYYPIETQANNDLIGLKFQISGTNWAVEKFLVPDKNAGNSVVVQALAGAQTYTRGRPASHLWIETKVWYVEGAKNEDGSKKAFTSLADAQQWAQDHTSPRYWTVEGTDQHFETQAAAQRWANQHATTTPGGCTIDNTCSKITTAMFNGARGAEKGFFVQVNGGTFNLQGNAELRDFITDPSVSYAAPVVSKGGTVNIKGGKITHNSVGYSANNADSGLPANKIGKETEDGWNEKGKLAGYANTESAGAIILTEKSKGVISGGEISGNRGDTGAIVVQGKPDRDRSGAQNRNVQNGNATASTLLIQNGTIDNNVGVHHAGGIYVFNGAKVQMDGGTISNNFAWNKGGAVWASEESYASAVWDAKRKGKPSSLPVGEATFILNGGTISGNMAVNRGGAIEVMSDHVALLKGQVINNYSRVLGGAVYVEGDQADRLYQLFIAKGCVTNNTAVPAQNNATSAPLYRTLNRGTDCNFSNAMNGPTAGDVSDHKDYNNYYGHAGGVWLCSFGGNTTFAIPNGEVGLWGNNSSTKGKDLVVRPLRSAATNGFAFQDLGNQVFKSDDNGAIYSNATVKGKILTGPIQATAQTTGTCAADGVRISGNVASDGGGIAANGNVVFGSKAEIAQAFTTLKVKKSWSSALPKKPVTFKFYAEVDGQRVELPGAEVTLNGKADTYKEGSDDPAGEDEYSDDTPAWEPEAWVAETGMPLSVAVGNKAVPLFTFDVNNTPNNPNDDLDPSKITDLIQIAKKVQNGQLTAANAKLANWKLIVVETIDGQVQENVIDLGGRLESLEYLGTDTTSLKDMNNKVVGELSTYKVGMTFNNDINNDIKPTAEKYVNKKVHDEIEFFDKEFTYDVMAYVPLDATKVTITDTLVEGLEFADANGKATTNGSVTVQQILIKDTNDHKPNGTVAQGSNNILATSNQTIGISGKTLTVTIDKAQPLNRIKGKWIQVTFKARIKDDYRTIDALQSKGWVVTGTNKQGSPLPSAENDGLVAALNTQLVNNGDYVVKGVIAPARLFAKTADGAYWTTTNKSGTNGWTQVNPGDGQWQNAHDRLEGVNPTPAMKLTVPPVTPNYPVLTNESHEGMANKATYTVTPAHDGVSSYETNTVTVKPETTELKVAKRWNVNGSDAWPNGIQKVTFGIFDSTGKQITTVDLAKGEAQPKTVSGLAKLQGVTYSAKEISVTTTGGEVKPVSGANDASATNGLVNLSNVLSYIATTIKEAETYVALNEAPQVEKYVKNNVHAELEGFDEVFEYSVMAYVPQGATKVEITDTLTDDLLFVDLNGKVQGETGFDATKLITNSSRVGYDLVIEPSNDHTVGGTVANHSNRGFYSGHPERHLNGPLGRADGVALSNGGKTITVTVNENELKANGKQIDAHGKWIVLSFRATINPDSYADVRTQLKAGADPAVPNLSWQKITDDKYVLGGEKPHAGLDNTAKYKVYVGNEGSSTYETNTVTVKPGITNVTATKTWLDENGGPLPWPTGVEVTINVLRSDTNAVVDTIALSEDTPKKTSKDLDLLEGVTYTVEEMPITTTNGDAYAEYGSVTGTGTDDDPYVFTNQKKGGPQIEKYINNGVHENLDAGFDTSFKYDIIAYVPENADSLEINDTLVNALEFAKAPDGGTLSNQQTAAAVAYKPGVDSVSDVVTSIVVKGTNDHTVRGTVADNTGTPLGTAAVPTIDGKHLKVEIADATAYHGQYIQVTFWAKYTQQMIDAANVGNSKTITGNGAVLGGMKSHTGTTNDASYKVEVGNTWSSDYKSNTVTVKGKDTQLEAAKQWQNADGTAANWPSGVNEVKVNVIKNGVKTDIADTITLTANSAIKKSKKLPVLVGVTYSLDEVAVSGYMTTRNGNTFINKDIGTPQIEKYINKDVDAHLVEYDKVIEYDIMAFVPHNATAIKITDPLVGSLEFSDATGHASLEKTEVVKSVVAKQTNDHKAKGTVSATNGTAVNDAAISFADMGKRLNVEITDATAYQGKWIQVTFYAKYTDDAIRNATTTPVPDNRDVDDNGSVISSITTHDGTANTASYTLKINNEWSSDYDSNTVTHDAKTVTVEAEKQWLNQDGSTAEWPSDVANVKVDVLKVTDGSTSTDVVDTITLTPGKPKNTSKALPRLTGVTYKIKEKPIFGYISSLAGDTVVNRDAGKPQIEKYINNGVHENLDAGFDTSFKYDIMAYVPEDADSLEINDTLVAALEFAKAPADGKLSNEQTVAAEASKDVTEVVTGIVAKPSNNHKVGKNGGTVVLADGAVALGNAAVPTISADGRSLKVEIADATAYQGKWIQVTFWAKYTQEMINTATVGNSKTITNNGTIIGGMARHDGTTNDATYKIEVRNDWSSDYKSNTVTVKGKSTQLGVEKTWNVNGSTAWPSEVESVTFGVFANSAPVMVNTEGNIDPAGTKQMTVVLNENKTSDTVTGLPVLVGVTYSAKEIAVNDTTVSGADDASVTTGLVKLSNLLEFIANTVKETVSDVDLFTTTNEMPSIEKYINHDVDAHLETFDTGVTYDILAYVPLGADSLVITDTLVPSLEFDTGMTLAESGDTGVNEAVTAIVAKALNNHTAGENGTVATTGDGDTSLYTPYVGGGAAVPRISGDSRTLTVTIDDATPYHGQWIQVTFKAKYTKAAINAAAVDPAADNADVTDNGTVISEIAEHDGTQNTASYKIKVGNDWTSNHKSNTVTHDAETVKLTVEKKWNVGGSTAWPTGVESVTFGVFAVKDGTETPVMVGVEGEQKPLTVKLTADKTTATVSNLPKLEGVTYVAREIKVGETDVTYSDTKPNTAIVKVSDLLEFIANTVKKTVGEGENAIDNFIATNEMPSIEKYINHDVDAHLVEFDKSFTYDILAYVPRGADSLEINDSLVDALEFAKADGTASDVPGEVVTAIVAKADNNHKAGDEGTVASTDGTSLYDAASLDNVAVPTIDLATKTLTVTIEDATDYQGQWIQVTFTAKYTEETIKAAEVRDSQTIRNNGTVITEIGEHDGTANTASYKIKVGNDWTSDHKSNTVTHDAETVTLPVEKQWKHADGRPVTTWPVDKVQVTVVNDATGEEVDTITLTQAQPKAKSKVLPKLTGVTYSIKETTAVEGYTSEIKGAVVVNTAESYPVEFSKRELGVDTKELEGAKIKVTGPDGFVEEWTSGTESHKLQLEPGEYTFEEVNAPEGFDAITTTVKFIVDENGTVTLKEAYEDINGAISVKDLNHLILEDIPTKYEVIISKQELGDDTKELPGARIKVTDSKGNVVDEWTSTTEAHKLKLTPGEYELEEVNAPEGFQAITTKIRFKVDNEGKVTVLNAEEITDGNVRVIEDALLNHLVLEDIRQTVSVTVTKAWLNAQKWPVAAPALWPAGAEVTVNIKDGDTVVKTVVLNADNQSETVTGLPKLVGRDYTVEEVELEGVFALEDTTEITSDEDGNVTAKLVNRLLPRRSELSVEVAKVDPLSKALEGAELEVTGVDLDGKVIDLGEQAVWTTDGTNHFLAHIVPGTYTLREKKAPKGYKVADPIEFEVTLEGVLKVDGKIASSVITMVDEPNDTPEETPSVEPTTPSPSPSSATPTTAIPTPEVPERHVKSLVRTGSPAGMALLTAFALAGAGAGLLVVRRRKA